MSNEKALAELHNYLDDIFAAKGLTGAEAERSLVPGLTQFGAVQYQTYQFNDAPKDLQDQVTTGRVLMERFVAVASAAVNAKSKTDSGKYDFKAWREVTQMLANAFFTDPVSGNKSLKTSVKGIEIAKNVIDFAGSVIAGNVIGFAQFLTVFGKGLNAEMQKTSASYNYLYAYSTHDLFKDPSGNIFYKPNFFVYGTFFSQEQRNITTSCGSTSSVELNFTVDTAGGTFRIQQYMADPNFRGQVDNFLKKYESGSIKDTDSYFEGVFENVQPDKKTYVFPHESATAID